MALVGTPAARLVLVLALGAQLFGCSLLTPLPRESSLAERLAVIPASGAPVEAEVRIYWDDHQIPFIEAKSDTDLAVALGIVHAHLRLGQMALMRRIARGRIAESAGPIATDIDHALRILNFGRAAEKMEASLPAETRAWLEGYARGVNHYLKNIKKLPQEYAVLGLAREPWTVRDLLTVGRLAGTDVNWLVWFRLLRLRHRPDWPALWARLAKNGGSSVVSFRGGRQLTRLAGLLAGFSRSGSNSLVLAPGKSASGAALMANDPHLGIMLPNLWLIAGYKSPSYHAVGLMIPGVPFMAVGRNPHIAWGGTNMRAANSDLYDVSKLAPAEFTERTERIRVR